MPVELNIVESVTALDTTVVEVNLVSASEPGPAGPGVPTGGTDGQVLTKTSATDYATAWEDPTGGGGGGAPTDATYLVTTANGDLSAEVVVGATPGGELGGTWASPTVDATHSGSSHASVQAAAEATAAAALLAHTTDSDDAHDASAISIADAGGDFTATDVEGALAELQADHETDASALTTHEADTTSVHGIADTSVLETTTGAQTKVDTHVNDATSAHAATAVSFTPAGTIAATTVQAAIEEVAAEAGGGAVAAEDVTVDSTALVGTGTDAQAVFEELDNSIADHIADASAAHAATAIEFTPAGTIAATTVQAAIEEAASESREIAYVERTTNLTVTGSEASPNDLVSAGAIVFDGSTRVCIEVYCPVAQKASTGTCAIGLWDGATELGGLSQILSSSNMTMQTTLSGKRYLTPSAGSHTYNVKAWRTVADGAIVAGTGTGGAGTWMPAFIRITREP